MLEDFRRNLRSRWQPIKSRIRYHIYSFRKSYWCAVTHNACWILGISQIIVIIARLWTSSEFYLSSANDAYRRILIWFRLSNNSTTAAIPDYNNPSIGFILCDVVFHFLAPSITFFVSTLLASRMMRPYLVCRFCKSVTGNDSKHVQSAVKLMRQAGLLSFIFAILGLVLSVSFTKTIPFRVRQSTALFRFLIFINVVSILLQLTSTAVTYLTFYLPPGFGLDRPPKNYYCKRCFCYFVYKAQLRRTVSVVDTEVATEAQAHTVGYQILAEPVRESAIELNTLSGRVDFTNHLDT